MPPKNNRKSIRRQAKTRVNEPDTAVRIIVDATKRALTTVQQRCTEALKAFDKQDHLVALGAIIGLDDQVRQVAARLMVLREVNEIQKQNELTGGDR